MVNLNSLSLQELFAHLTQTSGSASAGSGGGGGALERLLGAAFEEDLGLAGDITTRSIIPLGAREESTRGIIAAREAGVAAGLATLPAICARFDEPKACTFHKRDGEQFNAGDVLAELRMPLREMLAVERTTLNIIGRLSGIATLTKQYVNAISGTKTVICDTRKTTPGMRALEKYAVRCGGGTLHRLGLHDAALYKDNHLAGIALNELTDALSKAIASARARHPLRFVEVEVDDLQQLEKVLSVAAGRIDIVLLDNLNLQMLKQAVAMRDRTAQKVLLEASGGVNLNTVRSIAETGVDRISVGAITHSASWLDVGLDVEDLRR